jgi:hypothetical protein
MLMSDIQRYCGNKVSAGGFLSGKQLKQFHFYAHLGPFVDIDFVDPYGFAYKEAKVAQELGGTQKYPAIYEIGDRGRHVVREFLGIEYLNHIYELVEQALEDNEEYQLYKTKLLFGIAIEGRYQHLPPGDVLIKDKHNVKYYDGENWQKLNLGRNPQV